MIYRIVKYGDPILEKEAGHITEFGTPELRQLVDDMFETMYASKGVGLAAPQIGVSKKLTVIDIQDHEEGEKPEKIVLINPVILRCEGKQTGEEGCLSIPGFREQVTRANVCTVRGFDVEGNEFEITGEDLHARAFQHEIDHLHGKLFLAHLSTLKRDLIKRKIKKMVKAGEWDQD